MKATRAEARFGLTDRLVRAVPIVTPVALVVSFVSAAAPGLFTPDSWLALVCGREIAERGLPRTDHLTLLTSGRSWVDQQWLAQLVLYLADRLGGLGAVAVLSILALAVGLAIAANTARDRGASPVMILAFTVMTIVAAPWLSQFRPQTLAFPLFALTVHLLTREPLPTRWMMASLLTILVLWANVHGSVLLGVAMVMAYGAHGFLKGNRRSLSAGVLVLLAPAALLVSPYGPKLPGYYATMTLSPPFGRLVTEWQRTTPSPSTAAFFTLAAVTLGLAIVRRARLRFVDWMVLAVALSSALFAVRGIVWFGLAALAIAPGLASSRDASVAVRDRIAHGLAAVIVLGACAALALTVARPDEAFLTQGAADAAVVLRHESSSTSTVYADDRNADLLLWMSPALRGRVVYDVRFELLHPSEIERLADFAALHPGAAAVVADYDFVVTDRKHALALLGTGRWHRIYEDDARIIVEANGTRTRGPAK